ncbi:DEAD/DEAH box helicase [Corallococcus praedator]|uniref:DEAD/DEAH box helicase n=1 Tax=Corallococcus praedator TaxID=2316724 RepID=A0ABX9QGE8_9BACT|nr:MULTISPECIES: DEAD/DEAH box helicase [Corallococcus]RKH29202.1 DEAD/DEAH box helicase [Corallococcus sp. CA031C]RKI06822.1 DEAD/DEAH box helicase [Corallococcus praedator]
MPRANAPRSRSPLQQRLTLELLREVAGPERFARGEALLSRYGVTLAPPSAERIDGTVFEVRARRFDAHLRVDPDSDGLLLGCDCDDYWREGLCPHTVAVGLRWLGGPGSHPRWRPPTRTGKSSSRKPSASERPSSPPAIESWLVEHQATRARTVPVAVLQPLLPRSFERHLLHDLRKLTVVDVWAGAPRLRYLETGRRAQLVDAAWTWARDEAEQVRQGLAREASAPPASPPTDERLAPLQDALLRTRERVRAQALPRLLEPLPSITLQERPLRLQVLAPELEAWANPFVRAGSEDRLQVVLDPRAVMEGRPGLVCPCSPKAPEAHCVHALCAVDATLEMLCRPKQAARAAKLAELLFEAPGREILAALETTFLRRQLREAAPDTERSVTFRLEHGFSGRWDLKALLHHPVGSGRWSKGTAVMAYEREQVATVLRDPEEQQAFAFIEAGRSQMSFHGGSNAMADVYPLLLQALRALTRSPRLRLAGAPDAPARVREAPLGFALEPEGHALRLRPAVDGRAVDAEALWPPPSGPGAPHPWLLVEPDLPSVTLVAVPPEALGLLDSLRAHGTRVSERQRDALLGQLSALEAVFPVSLPPALEARLVEPQPGLLVRLRAVGESSLEGSLFVRPLPEAPPQPVDGGAPVVRGQRGGERVRALRDRDAERAEAEGLLERLSLPAGSYRFTRVSVEDSLHLLEALEPLTGPGVRVEWEEAPWTVVHPPGAASLRVEVSREHDWFGVKGGVVLEGARVELAVLLEAVRRRQRYIPLGKGRWMRLTEALREQLTPLADATHVVRQGLEVSAAAAPALGALAEAGARVKLPPDWRKLERRIREARALSVRVPRGLKAKLRDYQHEGFVWLARLCAWGAGACLADDMGLGKTLQALALLLYRAGDGPAMVVAPTSVCGNWTREAARFAPSLRLHVWRDGDREVLPSLLGPKDVLIISYGLLVKDAERLRAVSFATLVVDEAQAVKNPDTARARVLRAVTAEARVALTGTPVENRLSELWSLFQLIFPGLLGGRESFHARFAVPIERDQDALARASLVRVVRPFLLRRTKAEVARELPPRIDTVVPVTLSDDERRRYDDVRLAALARMGEEAPGQERRFELLAALTRLRLAACHPRLVDPDAGPSSSKLERFLARVEELLSEGSRALVFSQFVRHLALVREALEARGIAFQYLDGQTPPAERQARVEAFQRGEGALFLISLKAGGTGLNLTAADHVLHLDPWWNPAVEDQASDRAHRIGQTRPVTVSRFVSEGTIEEAILALHADKRHLADSLLSEADGAAALSPEQLLRLLRFGADPNAG